MTSATDDPRERIVEAATHLLREQGAAALTTRGVAQAAGVQAPTLYRIFGDKDGLLDALAEHVMAAHVAAKRSPSPPDAGPVEELRAGWRMHLDFALANPELYALLQAPGRLGPSPATVAGIEVLRTRVRGLATAGLLRVEEERALLMIHAAGSGAALALLATPPTERDPGLSEAMLEAVLGAILTTAPVVPDSATRTVAVTFAAVVPTLPGLSDAERALLGEWLARSLTDLRDT
ncbi:TetR/AcrR family transcriptional regulator [Nocardioides dongxiaopingii]|uniref:TetR/AcrR family transcriptional regulator n=1 Tax=Nocardioides sp. S-1144 TaxID=2582905 RepID=UPI001C9E4A35|nr:TetR/AcrR family transcriptional regulator [Nocardioides sp. S-1144]